MLTHTCISFRKKKEEEKEKKKEEEEEEVDVSYLMSSHFAGLPWCFVGDKVDL